MYKYLTILSLILLTTSAQGQVGIGTTNPSVSAALDITSNEGGLLVPRMTESDRTAINLPAEGLLVFQIDGNAGFYYYNDGIWLNISTVHQIDDLLDGRTDTPQSSLFLGLQAGLNDDQTENFNVGIGKSSLKGNTEGEHNVGLGFHSLTSNTSGDFNTGIGSQALQANLDGNSNTAVGFQSMYLNTDGNFNVALGDWSLRKNVVGNNNIAIGFLSGENSVGSDNIFLGSQAGQFETGSHKLIIENTNADENSALIYGEFDSDILRTNGTLQIGNPSMDGYAFPDTSGTTDQVLMSDGNGDVLWVDKSILGSNQLNDLMDAKSDNDGSDNGSSVFIGVNAGNADDLIDNRNVGIGYQSMMTNITGHENSALGYQTLAFNKSGKYNTASGYKSMYSNVVGNYNTAMGVQSLHDNTANFNTAIGHKALFLNTYGFKNTALGNESLRNNVGGQFCTAIGNQALQNNNIGNHNTAFGSQALYSNTDGQRNTALGMYAGYNNILGDSSVFIGYRAGFDETNNSRLYINNSGADQNNTLIYGEFDNHILRTNGTFQVGNPSIDGYALPSEDGAANQILQTNGSGDVTWATPSSIPTKLNDLSDCRSDDDGTDDGSSVFVGLGAGIADNTNDNRNVALGFEAMNSSVSSRFNTAIGYQALRSNTQGFFNTATGFEALENNISGQYNTANGFHSLKQNTTGHNNTANGYEALGKNTTGTHNTASGNNALLANTSGLYNSAFGNSVLTSNTNGENNSAIGYVALNSNKIGNNNSAVGVQSLFENSNGNGNTANGTLSLKSNISGSNNTALGYRAFENGTNHSNSMALGYNTGVSGSNQVHIGNTAITEIKGQVNFTTYSDRRIKDNITEDVKGLEFINALRPVSYYFNIDRQNQLLGITDDSEYEDKYALENIKISGFIAQEVEAAAQASGYDFSGVKVPSGQEDLYGLSYAEFVVPLVKAVQEQQAMLLAKDQKIDDLEYRLELLEKQQSQLSATFNQLRK